MAIKVSVITATYNKPEYLKDAIESVQASIRNPLNFELEHIIVDDASSTDTLELCQQYHQITYIRNETNLGVSKSLRRGLEAASGTYIFVLDHDDVLLQRTLHHLAEIFENNPEVDWIFTDFLRLNERKEYIIGQDYFGWEFDTIKDQLTGIFSGRHFIQHNVMYKRSLYDKVSGYDSRINVFMDLDMFIRFLLAGHKPMYAHVTSHLHRFHDSNLSIGHDGVKHLENVNQLKVKYLSELKNLGIT